MKTGSKIKECLAQIESDSRYQSGLKHPATIEENAPLALIQLEMETKVKVLKWVLS